MDTVIKGLIAGLVAAASIGGFVIYRTAPKYHIGAAGGERPFAYRLNVKTGEIVLCQYEGPFGQAEIMCRQEPIFQAKISD